MGAKVLVVEDDTFLASAYKAKLTKSGYETEVTSEGNEALNSIKTFQPAIILLDLLMPGMDGFAFLEELKKNPESSKIPVIVASNLDQPDAVEKAMGLGAAGYIIKSDLSMDELVSKIQAILNTPAA